MKKLNQLKFVLLFSALMLCCRSVCAETVTYTVVSKTSVTTSGTAPDGSSVTFESTAVSGELDSRISAGKSQTLTLSGYSGYRITELKLNIYSNGSAGAGKLAYSVDGGSSFTYLIGSNSVGIAFDNSAWNGSYTKDDSNVVKKNVSIDCGSSDVVIKIEGTANALYCKSYTLTYEIPDERTAVNMTSFTATKSSLIVDQTTTTSVANDQEGWTAAYTYSSDDESVATVSAEGVISAVAAGTAHITAALNVAVNDENYKVGTTNSKTITITVTERSGVDPVDGGDNYVLVTDASTLADGDCILFVNSTADGVANAMSTTQAENYRMNTTVSIKDGVINTIGNDVQVVTLEGTTDNWYFNVGSGYLYAASSSSNYLRTQASKDNNAKAKIEIGNDNLAKIVFQGANTHNELRFYGTIFSSYDSKSSCIKPYIYRYVKPNEFNITISSVKWRTLVAGRDVSLPDGVKAYIVTASDAENAILTEAANIKANEPYLLYGPEGTHTLTVIDSADEPTGNQLRISDSSTSNGVYVLSNRVSHGVGFYVWEGGQLGAGRVYLPANFSAREFVGFDFCEGETTGISTVHASSLMVNGYYDLQGRKVAQPTKGLYIVNGKKVIVK